MPIEDAYSSGHLVLSSFGTCMCSNVETNLSWTCLGSGLLSFEHPSVLQFCFKKILRLKCSHHFKSEKKYLTAKRFQAYILKSKSDLTHYWLANSWAWLYTVTLNTDGSFHLLVTLLTNWNLLPSLTWIDVFDLLLNGGVDDVSVIYVTARRYVCAGGLKNVRPKFCLPYHMHIFYSLTCPSKKRHDKSLFTVLLKDRALSVVHWDSKHLLR